MLQVKNAKSVFLATETPPPTIPRLFQIAQFQHHQRTIVPQTSNYLPTPAPSADDVWSNYQTPKFSTMSDEASPIEEDLGENVLGLLIQRLEVDMEEMDSFVPPLVDDDVVMEEKPTTLDLVQAGEDGNMQVDVGLDLNLGAEVPLDSQEPDEEMQELPPIISNKRKFRGSLSKPKEPLVSSGNSRKKAKARQGREVEELITENPSFDQLLADHFLAATSSLSKEERQKLLETPVEKLLTCLKDLAIDN